MTQFRFLIAVALSVSVSPARAWPIQGPYDVAARRAAMGAPMPPVHCPAAPPPVAAARGVLFYRAGTGNSVPDPALVAANDAVAAPINAFTAFVIHTADDYMRARPADPARAACVLAWLDAWAQEGALLAADDAEGRYLRNWTQADLAIAYLTVRDAPALDPDRRRRVERWLGALGAAVNADFRDMRERNNHLYWAGLSAVSAGAVTGDSALFGWGIAAARAGLADIQADGTLPREMARRGRALAYHVFAFQALTMIAAFGARNGIDLWHERDGALLRLGGLLTADLLHPGTIAGKAAAVQDTGDMLGWPSRRSLSWAEPFYAVAHDARLVPFLLAFRPYIGSVRGGGDMTLAFGAPMPE